MTCFPFDSFSRSPTEVSHGKMTVEKIAREDVVTATPDTPIPDVATRMEEENVGSVVVVEDEAPVGMLTDRDLALNIWGMDNPEEAVASDLMTEETVTVGRDDEIYTALRTAREAGVRRLPVTQGDKLVGILAIDDAIVLLAGEFEEISHLIQEHAPPY